jgi:hypothetical protein
MTHHFLGVHPAGLLFRSHASSKRNIIRNESNASRSRGFPAVVPWAGDTSRVSTSGDGMLSSWEVASYEELGGRPKGRPRGVPLYLY